MNRVEPIGKVVGVDHLGHIYREEIRINQTGRKKVRRWIDMEKREETSLNIYREKLENVDKKQFNMFDIPQVPPLWESWLRGRREHPPSIDEIESEIVRIENIERWKKKEKKSLSSSTELMIEKRHTNSTTSFPSYDDYDKNKM
ncbi:hypothetical protein SNEBB_004315 [Seison nebaliae]|nr:hypothetical protein SNEBB_004315 [Seison nebaliae]